MALLLLSVVAGKSFVKSNGFSEESYFYFFLELSCLPLWNGTNVRVGVLRRDWAALDQGFCGGRENAGDIYRHQGFPGHI